MSALAQTTQPNDVSDSDGQLLKVARLPRIMASGADYNDVQQIVTGAPSDQEWCRRWVEFGAIHERLGDEALAEGGSRSAGEAFARAAVYYHTGQSGNGADPAEKLRVQHLQQAVYAKGARYLSPPAEQLQIPYKGVDMPGNLRRPAGAEKAPCVLLLAGADSTKEEFYTLENTFLERGVGTFSFDGPGQSLTRQKLFYEHDVETSVSAILDVLERHAGLDPVNFAVWGRSLGGYGAPRAAAADSRISACVSAGGFYDMGEYWDSFPSIVRTNLGKVIGAMNADEAREMAFRYSLADQMARVKCPLLVVHSHGDVVCSYKDGERMARETGGPVDLRIYPKGDHACDNIAYEVRPMTADWVARQLGVSAS